MDENVHFDGDPAVDSRRRHLERVLKGQPPRRKWPWIVAAVAGGAWALWRSGRPRTGEAPRASSAGRHPDGRQ
jgi:hypothetical protein